MGAKALRQEHALLFEELQGGYCGWSGGRGGRVTGEMTKSRSEKCYRGKHSRVKGRESWGEEGDNCAYKEVRKLECGRSTNTCK